MNNMKDFLKNREERRRALPIFILADISGSMEGAKIKQLNRSLSNMLTQLKEEKSIPGKFKLCVISFNDHAEVIQSLEDVENITLEELQAGGMTAMGEAFDLVSSLVEDQNIVKGRDYAPTIVLMSDGAPTDVEIESESDLVNWESLCKLKEGTRSQKAQRLALAIGEDADEIVLKEFIGNEEIPLIKANDEKQIMQFLKWVTMSVIARLQSVDPNEVKPLVEFPTEGNS